MAELVSLEALIAEADERRFEVVDPGVPLHEYFSGSAYGRVWKSQPSVRKVAGFIARQVASLPFDLFRRADKGREKVRPGDFGGALARFMKSPSTAIGQSPYRVWESLLIDSLLHDYYVGVVAHSTKSGRNEVRRIPAHRVRFKGALGTIDEVLIEQAGNWHALDPASLIVDVGYSQRGVSGTSPVETLKELLDTQTEAVEYRRKLFKNGARLSGVIERPKDAPWSPDARDRFKRDWNEFTAGGVREGGTALLQDGMAYKSIESFRPRDTEDLESRRLTDIEVCSMYYVAPELLGIREGNFSNVKAFMQQLYGPSLGPYIAAFEQALNRSLLPMFGLDADDFYIEANVDAKLRGSFEEQAAILSTATGRPWMLTDEARDRMNLPHIEGGDQLVTPLNVLIGGQASPQDGVTEGQGGGSLEALEEGAE